MHQSIQIKSRCELKPRYVHLRWHVLRDTPSTIIRIIFHLAYPTTTSPNLFDYSESEIYNPLILPPFTDLQMMPSLPSRASLSVTAQSLQSFFHQAFSSLASPWHSPLNFHHLCLNVFLNLNRTASKLLTIILSVSLNSWTSSP